MTSFIEYDGGRKLSGYKGICGDCVIRAICIAGDLDYKNTYKELHNLIKEYVKNNDNDKTRAYIKRRLSPRNGLEINVYGPFLRRMGFKWEEKIRLFESIPKTGIFILVLDSHLCTYINGVLYDTKDWSKNGKAFVYGYWSK